jgi:hypothetical protein
MKKSIFNALEAVEYKMTIRQGNELKKLNNKNLKIMYNWMASDDTELPCLEEYKKEFIELHTRSPWTDEAMKDGAIELLWEYQIKSYPNLKVREMNLRQNKANKIKSNENKENQEKQNQIKENEIKLNQIKLNEVLEVTEVLETTDATEVKQDKNEEPIENSVYNISEKENIDKCLSETIKKFFDDNKESIKQAIERESIENTYVSLDYKFGIEKIHLNQEEYENIVKLIHSRMKEQDVYVRTQDIADALNLFTYESINLCF